DVDALREAIISLGGHGLQQAGNTRTLLVVDQFEEIFTLTKDQRTRERYIDALLTACRVGSSAPIHVVFVVRADFYQYCLEYPELSRCLAVNQYNLLRMSPGQLRETIEKRLQLAGACAEVNLVETLLEEVGSDPGSLALMEHALG